MFLCFHLSPVTAMTVSHYSLDVSVPPSWADWSLTLCQVLGWTQGDKDEQDLVPKLGSSPSSKGGITV